MKNFLFSLIVPTLFPVLILAAKYTGRVSVFTGTKQVSVIVDLPNMQDRSLSDDLVIMENKPTNLVADSANCFCFTPDDDRSVFVSTYYYSTQALLKYNSIMSRLRMKPLSNLRILLNKSANDPGEGVARMDNIELNYSKGMPDLGTLTHEIGHWIHYQLLGFDKLPFKKDTTFSQRSYAEKSGITEGTANLLAAWVIGDSHINKFTLPEFPYDVNTFIRFPDAFISRIETLKVMSNISRIQTDFPSYTLVLENTIDQYQTNSQLKDYLDQPDEYMSSAIINQPLWQASLLFGIPKIAGYYLQALASLKSASSYSDLAKVVVAQVKEKEIKTYLVNAFKARGLQPE